MRSHARQEKRLLKEQETVGAQRDERQEQARLGTQRNVEIVVPKGKRQAKLKADPVEDQPLPQRRIARPGKPLKR